MADKNTLKNWFKTGLKPTQAQFWAWMDSYFHKDEKIPITAIDEIEGILDAKAEAEALTNHLTDENAHADLFEAKENSSNKGVADGYAPLNELAKIASDYLTIVDDLTTGGSDALASAETVKTLKGLIDGINVILGSDNVNLDNVQELVDAIETIQLSLSTILVNDLTTGGTTKALTAEQGKVLKGLIDDFEPTPQDLQDVLNANGSAESNDGFSIINMRLDSVREFYAQMVNGSNVGQVKANTTRSFLRNANASNDAIVDIDGGLVSISQSHIADGYSFTTTIDFETPIANTLIKAPAKPAGTYTLATTDDLGGDSSDLQSVLDAGADAIYSIWNKVLLYHEYDFGVVATDLICGTETIEAKLHLNNEGQAQLSSKVGSQEAILDLDGGYATLSQGQEGGYYTNLRFENPINNATIRITAPVLSGTYKSAVIKATAPSSSSDAGSLGEIRVVGNNFYWYTGTQWLKVTGSTF